jgi:cobyrinic acid a,c-diamide synthase
MRLTTPRLTVAGPAGDSGKTLVSLGLIRAFVADGVRVAPYKKGPDFIDAAWLGAAAGRPGRNLDTFLMPAEALGASLERSRDAEVILIEGNRGLFDGMDEHGSHSTATLAHRLGSPVLLVVDVAKVTRTAAAFVLGCRALDPDLALGGVVLNRVATPRQERLVRAAIESATGVPVLGAVPRLPDGGPLPGRHLGLMTAVEHPAAAEALEHAAEAVASSVNVEAVLELARKAAPLELPVADPQPSGEAVRVAVVRDEAFSFYYPENLEALVAGGARLTFVSPLDDETIPEVDAVYIGGGFPELYAERISRARGFAESLRAAERSGVSIFAECGGLMVLARELRVSGRAFPMAGILDLVVEQTARPQGHGYVTGTVEGENPFFAPGTALKGHEFHYSRVVSGTDAARTAVRLERGTGIGGRRDGIARGRVWASYLHLHALATPGWAAGLLSAARGGSTGTLTLAERGSIA